MFYLTLHRFNESGTMGSTTDNFIEFNLPIDLLGPFEVNINGTLIQLRDNMGSIIVEETTEKIRQMVSEMMAAAQNRG